MTIIKDLIFDLRSPSNRIKKYLMSDIRNITH